MRAVLVHNANSGTKPVSRAAIEKVVRSAGIEPIYVEHQHTELPAALAQQADLIIAAGGDGTVADVVSTLKAIGRPIGILPLGGSNNIAHTLGVDGDWRTLPARWSLERWTRLDRCEASGPWGRRPFVEALGSGVLTDAVEDADDEPRTPAEKQRNGRAAFRAALEAAEPFDCTIEAEHWRWSGACLMVEVMNVPVIGSRLKLAATGEPGDGLLNIVIATPDDRAALSQWAKAPEAAPAPAPFLTAPEVRLTVTERMFRVDDRSPDQRLSGTVSIKILPESVRILTPEETSG